MNLGEAMNRSRETGTREYTKFYKELVPKWIKYYVILPTLSLAFVLQILVSLGIFEFGPGYRADRNTETSEIGSGIQSGGSAELRPKKVHRREIHETGEPTDVLRLEKGDTVVVSLSTPVKSTVYFLIHDGGAKTDIALEATMTSGHRLAQFLYTGPIKKDKGVDCFDWTARGSFDPELQYSKWQYILASDKPVNIAFVAHPMYSKCPS